MNEEVRPTNSSSGWLWTIVIPLWLVFISNQWSRSSLYYLVDFSNDATPYQAMNVDIGFDEAQYGFLASVAFTILYSVASLGAGVASDRYNRKTLTIASAMSWVVATVGTAYSSSYTQVVLWRIAMGLACAFSAPAAYTLIQQKVPTNRVALASSWYGTAVSLASGLSSLSILLDQKAGWRTTEELIALFGVVALASAAVLVPSDDPKDEGTEQASEAEASPSSILDDVKESISIPRTQWIFLGSMFRFCSGLCIGVWSAPFYRMTFAESQSQYALYQAAISVVGATASNLAGGAAADWLSSSDGPVLSTQNADEVIQPDTAGIKLWVPIIGNLLAAPAWYFAVQTDQSFDRAMMWLAVEYLVAECWFGATIASLQSSVPSRIGGTAQGLFTLTGGLANLAPSALGYLYAAATEGSSGGSSAELSGLLASGVGLGYLLSALCWAMAVRAGPPQIAKDKGA